MLDRVDVKFFRLAVGSNIGRDSDSDVSASCPVCGDGQKRNSKRLHLYNKGTVTNVNCFNGDCSVVNKTVYSFLRDFFPDLLPQYKRETFSNSFDNFKDSGLKNLVKKIEPESKVKPVITQDLSMYMLHLKESDDGIMYLRNRGIEYLPNKRGKWYFGTQDLKIGETLYKITNSIVIPLYYDDEMYGFYSRSIKGKDFITYMDDRNIGYKLFNFFKINLNEPVIITEGIFDAISTGKKNIIALLGAKLPEDRLKEIKHPVFVLDLDKTGTLNSIKYAKMGYWVYVQPKVYKGVNIIGKDMNEIMLNHPELNMSDLIDDNIFKGMSAVVRLQKRL
jgi:hypothetical protein